PSTSPRFMAFIPMYILWIKQPLCGYVWEAKILRQKDYASSVKRFSKENEILKSALEHRRSGNMFIITDGVPVIQSILPREDKVDEINKLFFHGEYLSIVVLHSSESAFQRILNESEWTLNARDIIRARIRAASELKAH
ncbi:hypothetical protein KI387_030003, partial [Taxus chinensis]